MTNADSELALVEHQRNYRLPGGGSEPGESLEISLTRELREEPSLQILVDKRWWSAIQHVVADVGIHYELRPTYFSDTRIANIEETSKHSPLWLIPDRAVQALTRPCDAWAVTKCVAVNA